MCNIGERQGSKFGVPVSSSGRAIPGGCQTLDKRFVEGRRRKGWLRYVLQRGFHVVGIGFGFGICLVDLAMDVALFVVGVSVAGGVHGRRRNGRNGRWWDGT